MMSSENQTQQPCAIDVDTAIALLLSDQVVALPTETVYGLAGRIGSEQSLRKIFSTKNRPFFDPLIVHVRDRAEAQDYAQWDPLSLQLAQEFWPGPLTLVLPRIAGKVSDLITNGGDTVALRCPQHPLFQKVLAGVGEPLAAPSANRFGHTSPTQADHVLQEFSSHVPVVDGGPCLTGIESTIVQVKPDDKEVLILRPGHIDQETLSRWVSRVAPDFRVELRSQNNAPGFLQFHYQPSSPLILAYESHQTARPRASDLEVAEALKIQLDGASWRHWLLPDNPELAARQMYADMRRFAGPMLLWIPLKWRQSSSWQGILDRLIKASSASLAWHDKWQLKSKT